jgi:nitrite reductase/ring-hydroxylating ferredoxin subunit/uncharacterized membrane protein
MDQIQTEEMLSTIPRYKESAHAFSHVLHNLVLGNSQARQAADLFHGTWLGHPLHAVLTDLTIGAWVLGTLFDFLGLFTRSKTTQRAADRMISMGNASAVPTALAGITDFSTIPHRATATGATHGLLNTVGLALNLLSARERKSGRQGSGVFLSTITSSLLLVTAWLGGELSYRYRIGVDKTGNPSGPEDWQPVMNDEDLVENQPVRVEAGGFPVLLYRHAGGIYAIGAVCGHEGGPLEKGSFNDLRVTCPWHQSVYDLKDGGVVHGPTVYAEPRFQVRVQNGKVEVKR